MSKTAKISESEDNTDNSNNMERAALLRGESSSTDVMNNLAREKGGGAAAAADEDNGTTCTSSSSTTTTTTTTTITTPSNPANNNITTSAASSSYKKINNMTREQLQKEESKGRKILMRVVFATFMLGIFTGTVYMGHLYICLLVALIEMLLFRELVRVRYSAFFHTIEDTIPLFRTTQWLWFAVAIFYTYGDFVSDMMQNNQETHYLLFYAQFLPTVQFLLYSGTFVLTIFTLQREHVKFQLNQLCWTVLVLCLTIGQLKYVMHNIFNGLIWFVLPCCLVFVNDIMAYVTGMNLGRKYIQRPFISFSPNKTWEGFIGGWFFTMITAWYLSAWLSQYTWMTCPTNKLLPARHLECPLDLVFLTVQHSGTLQHPYAVTALTPTLVRRVLRLFHVHITEMCNSSMLMEDNNDAQQLSSSISSFVPCASITEMADVTHGPSSSFHHLAWTIEFIPIQVHALWLGLFASLVAPFGGFFASAIKRAYGIKDFDSIIPGHGGVMDRMDCQFIMALCTWVHYRTFRARATVSVPKLVYMYSLLTTEEQGEFLALISS